TVAVARVGAGVLDRALQGCHLQGVNLRNAALVGAHPGRDQLQTPQLENASLLRATLQGAPLPWAHPPNTHLQSPHLPGATRPRVDRPRPSPRGAALAGAKVPGAPLPGALGSTAAWADGTHSDNNGGTCANPKQTSRPRGGPAPTGPPPRGRAQWQRGARVVP